MNDSDFCPGAVCACGTTNVRVCLSCKQKGMNALDLLIQTAKHSGQLMAEDKPSGVRVLVKRGHLGWMTECYLHGERRHYNVCLRALTRFDAQMGGNHEP